MEMLVVTLASLLAGFVDSIVGGGGLILVPALFAVFPGAPPATLLGTNKSASIWGTAAADATGTQSVKKSWGALLPAALLGVAGATLCPGDALRRALPLVLLGVLLYTLARKDLGRHHAPRFTGRAETLAACAIGFSIGLYDGFFGPGAGSFLVFLFVRWMGYDFLNASASAKVINVLTNAAALLLLAFKGHVWWHYGLVMAVANVAGSLLGTRVALRHGAGFVRVVFIVVVSALILKTAYDAFFK